MAKILRLYDKTEPPSASAFMTDSAGRLMEEGAESVLIAAKCSDGQVVTAYYHCDFGERQELCGHIQCDIVDQMIRANLDRYLEEE